MAKTELVEIIHAAEMGDADARDRLFTTLYDELRRWPSASYDAAEC